MASYTVKFHSIINGKVNTGSTQGTSVTANSEHEAREKFKSNHDPSKYRIVSVVKQ
jgi:hypothetical protein